MSLIHNMKQNFEMSSQQGNSAMASTVVGNPTILAMFYLTNQNPNEEEITKFVADNKFQKEMVINYLKQRKNQDNINSNIMNMKYGIKYTRPDEKLIKEFENNSLNQNMSEFELNIGSEIFSENIPKKVKKPEFQVTNDNSVKNDYSSSQENEHSYSSNNNKSSLNYFTNDRPIDDPKLISNIISSMKKENKLEPRLIISNVLNNIDSNYCLDRFMQLNGNQILGYWIEDYKEEIESSDRVDPRIYDILTNLLKFCDKLPITVQDLKTSKIGKKINKLGKCVSDRVIKTKCEELVSRWKKLIENIKDKKRDKHERERSEETSRDIAGNYSSSHDIYKSSSSTNSEYHSTGHSSSSLNKKSKREISSSSAGIEFGLDKNNKKARHENSEEKELTSSTLQNTNNSYVNTNQSFMKKSGAVSVSESNYISPNPNLKNKNIIKKGILKKVDPIKKREKKVKVKFEFESKMEKVKIFKMTDEPGAAEVTEEEYQKIQNEILKNPEYKYLSDMRSKEINMEKENMSKAREKNKHAKDALFRMVPQMTWRRPYELKIKEFNQEENDDDYGIIIRGSESEEKQIVDVLCQKILSVTYFREAEIPDCPKIGASELFCFTNEEIPKIENMKKAYDPDKPNPNADILEIIDKNYEVTPSPDFIKTLIKKIQDKEFTQEECTKILEYLNKHSNTNKDNLLPANPQMKMMPMPFHPHFAQFNQFSNQNVPTMSTMGMNTNFNPNLPMDKKFITGNKMPMHQMGFNQMPMHFNKIQPAKYKTRPCRNFHGPNGCTRGDNCHFIHDNNYEGKEVPNFNYLNYKNLQPNEKYKDYTDNSNKEMDIIKGENVDEKIDDKTTPLNLNNSNVNMNQYPMNQFNQNKNPNFNMGNSNFNRPPFNIPQMMPNMQIRPPFMNNMNMNQNPYWNMNMNNFIRGPMQMNNGMNVPMNMGMNNGMIPQQNINNTMGNTNLNGQPNQ